MMGKRIKQAFSWTLRRALGRQYYARLGRFLWMQSRLDVPNDIRENGETLVHEALCRCVTTSAAPVVVFDIGANVGGWSALLVDAWQRASLDPARLSLHLFEPVPQAREALHVLRDRALGRVHIVASAVSETPGTAEFLVRPAAPRRSSLRSTEGATDGEACAVHVAQVSIDSYCDDLGIERVDLIKIDTEGNDMRALRGATEMLRAHRIGMIQFEYNHLWVSFRNYLKDVFDLVVPLGYRVGKVTPLGVEVYPAWHPELESFREGNYLVWEGTPPMRTVSWWLTDVP